MNPVLAIIQLFHVSEKFAAYSLAVHAAIGTIIWLILDMLQVENGKYPISDISVCIYFGVGIIYVVLGAGELIGRQLQPAGSLVLRFVGHTSHVIGALEAILLISVVSVVFAYVLLALLFFLWIPMVILTESRTTDSNQPLPV